MITLDDGSHRVLHGGVIVPVIFTNRDLARENLDHLLQRGKKNVERE